MKNDVALVLETNNLHSKEDAADVESSLQRLFRHLNDQTVPLADLSELVITHEGLGEQRRRRLNTAAGCDVTWVELSKGTGYYAAKRAGFEATVSDVVVFGDTDCWPVAEWLERLTTPFENIDVEVVAGRTTYPENLVGIAGTTIDFMYFDGVPADYPTTRNFYANNVAFRRDVFERYAYEELEGVYRGHCQVLGMRLFEAGVPIRFESAARTIHELPESAREFGRLRLFRGSDAAQLSRQFVGTYAPAGLKRLAERRTTATAALLTGRLLFSQSSLGEQDMPAVTGLRRAAARAAILGVSSLDAIGACLRLAGVDLGIDDGRSVSTESVGWDDAEKAEHLRRVA